MVDEMVEIEGATAIVVECWAAPPGAMTALTGSIMALVLKAALLEIGDMLSRS